MTAPPMAAPARALAGHTVAERLKNGVRGPGSQPAWARPAAIGLLLLTAVLYLAGLSRNGWANDFYSAAVQAGLDQLEGVLLRLVRRGQRHHRGQDPGVAVGHGAVRAGLRAELLERAGAPGAGRRGLRGRPVRHGETLVRPGRRAAGRRGARADPGGRADVPVQQPGRAAGPAADRGGLRRDAGHRVRPDPVAGSGRRADRLRLPGQDAAGVPGPAAVRAGLPGGRAAAARPAGPAAAGRRRRGGGCGRLVGGRGDAHPGGRPALRGRLDQ